MYELLKTIELLKEINHTVTSRVVFEFLTGERDTPLTSKFLQQIKYLLINKKEFFASLSPYFRLLSNRLISYNTPMQVPKGVYPSYSLREKYRKEQNIKIKEELSDLYVKAWTEVKEKYFDTTYFDTISKLNAKNFKKLDLEELKFNIAEMKSKILSIK